MNEAGPNFDALRQDVAEVERGMADSDDGLRAARARFLLAANGRSIRPAGKRISAAWAAFALAATVVLGFFGWTHSRHDAPLRFDMGSEHAPGQIGELLSSPESEPLPVRFSDGTSLSLAAATRARVTDASEHGATVVLEEGALSVAVVHRAATRWHVSAGPFTVLVTGTKFDVRWVNATLTLDLHEGSVTVLGPSLSPGGRHVVPGETLRMSAAEPRATDGSEAPTSSGNVMALPATRDGDPKTGAVDTGASRPSWKQLAQEGRYPDALAAAEAEGFEAACRRASAADLVVLGETARFAGSPKRAEQALHLVRLRAGAKHEAAMAAFTLGRIAYDGRGYRDAARWFGTYLREEPSGSVAREAAGRLIEAEKAAGDVARARDAASAYLAKYPAGPHAGLARTILNE
jgi:hypothetical protein